MNFQPISGKSRCKFRRTTSVEANAFEQRGLIDQGIEIVGFSGADVSIECAGSHAGAIDVPDADTVRQNTLDTFGVRQFMERLRENRAK